MGRLEILSSALVYVDTSVVIYTIEENPSYYSLLRPLWAMFQANEITIMSSELTLMETLVVPLRNSDDTLVETYEQLLLGSSMHLMSVNQTVLREAARLRASTNLKTPDAIHAATALMQDCTLFLTNDDAFRRIRDLPVTVLSEVLAAE
ncbi:MAG: type II toxin-antitoxin system VapC family toxin [Elainellaceae cyanobacterium]